MSLWIDMLLVSKQYGLCDRKTNIKSINGEINHSDGHIKLPKGKTKVASSSLKLYRWEPLSII